MTETSARETGEDIRGKMTARLSAPLPGPAAHNLMAPPDRLLQDDRSIPEKARQSAVLLLITRNMDLVFVRRADNGGRHSGQIAFPGGMEEEDDGSPEDTALRETEEEIGIPREKVEIAGRLSRIYIPITGISVQPVVGWLDGPEEFRLQKEEIDEVLRFPIGSLYPAGTEARVKRHFGMGKVPCYRIGKTVIWGATAMMTSEFLAVWNEVSPGDSSS